jgi:two-component sensor histidine kinase
VEALEVFVDLLSEADAPGGPEAFYNRICEAVCRLTRMDRAVLFLYDEGRREVRGVGGHGLDVADLADVRGTLEETPVAQRALAGDRVVVVAERIEAELPPGYERFLPIAKLACTPVSAAGRWFGVILADRGRAADFELSPTESHALWTLGKLAALASSARIATRQQERARRLGDRIDLARDIHERVVQRLFGVSLVLSAEHELGPEERTRLSSEVSAALADLREALGRPLASHPRATQTTLRAELERLAGGEPQPPLEVTWTDEAAVPPRIEALAQAALREALRNAAKHATPGRISVAVSTDDGALVLEIENDGVADAPHAARGVGLRLTAFEALQQGGVLEFGPPAPGRWRVRLVVPLDER